jgi:hypothetical protein
MENQIDVFCVPQLADTGRLKADHSGGFARLPASSTSITLCDRHEYRSMPAHQMCSRIAGGFAQVVLLVLR